MKSDSRSLHSSLSTTVFYDTRATTFPDHASLSLGLLSEVLRRREDDTTMLMRHFALLTTLPEVCFPTPWCGGRSYTALTTLRFRLTLWSGSRCISKFAEDPRGSAGPHQLPSGLSAWGREGWGAGLNPAAGTVQQRQSLPCGRGLAKGGEGASELTCFAGSNVSAL